MQAIKVPVALCVQLDDQSHDLSCLPGETLLEAALREGLDVPYSCMAGVCTACRADIKTGQVEMEVNDALTNEEVSKGATLTCQAQPTSTQPIHVVFPSQDL